jgi:hypothetical protein
MATRTIPSFRILSTKPFMRCSVSNGHQRLKAENLLSG